jgi:exonuclease SbcD
MRFIHTADWHLGRIFHGVHLTEDQAFVLDQLVDVIRDTRADALLVAGDVYDRPVPPADAVRLLDDCLSRVILGLGIPVVIIAGNHDSPDRLAFASALLSQRGLHLFGSISSTPSSLILEDAFGPVRIVALPYAEPPLARQVLGDPGLSDHNSAMKALVARAGQDSPPGIRTVLVAHAFVTGGTASDSERPLSVGGAGTVEASTFEGFQYVALGHLHRAQTTGAQHIQYSGSIFKYSFSEAGHNKSFTLVELDESGTAAIERIPIGHKRDVRCVSGTIEELLRGPGQGESSDDYIMATLMDREPVLDPMGKLLSVYPNLLHIERAALSATGELGGAAGDHRGLSDIELFRAFFSQVTGESLSEMEEKVFLETVEQLRREEREASA